jgi:hypothetical protein
MLPDGNNVYGHVEAPRGLEQVLAALQPHATGGRVWLETSGYDGTTTLHLESDALDFATTPLGGGSHLFNGGVAGPAAEVLARVEAISSALSAAGLEHGFEIYDADQNLVCVVPASVKDRVE